MPSTMLPVEVVQSIVQHPERPLPPPGQSKLSGYEFYRNLNSPKRIVAPMVDQSELAWRILSRLHGSDLVYTPMIHARLFNPDMHPAYVKEQFDLSAAEGGAPEWDRPLIAQFCANDKDEFLRGATLLAASGACDAVDLNLGCPQGIAKRGHYGAFLMEDWALIESLIHHLHVNLSVPITAKFRVYDTVEQTVQYAQMLERAGAQIITCHGRTRDQKGQLTGLADWAKIKAVKQAITSIPVFANGNILTYRDAEDCLAFTGCDGVMTAEGNLSNPALFDHDGTQGRAYLEAAPAALRTALEAVPAPAPGTSLGDYSFPDSIWTCRRYLAIVECLKTATASSAIRAHLFKLLHAHFEDPRFQDMRSRLAMCGSTLADFKGFLDELAALVGANLPMIAAQVSAARLQLDTKQRLDKYPLSVCQPHYRKGTPHVAIAETLIGSKRSAEPPAEAQPAKKPRMELKPCVTAACTKQAAGKCCRSACKDCCAHLAEASPDICEQHAAKANKAAEKRAFKAAKRNQRKAGGLAAAQPA